MALKRKLRRLLKGPYSLKQIGQYYGTDKVDVDHSFNEKCYLDVYERYFREWKSKPVTLVEIGIREGNSLRAYRDYFEKGLIVGVDINPVSYITEPRIKSFIGSQDAPDLVEEMHRETGDWDIVIDDGSHINALTLASFQLMFPKLKPGGIYIFEDLYCSYLGDQLPGDIERGQWPGMQYNDPNLLLHNDRGLLDRFFQERLMDLDHKRGDIEFIHFWAQVCIIGKKG